MKKDTILGNLDLKGKETYDFKCDLKATCDSFTPIAKQAKVNSLDGGNELRPLSVFMPMLARRSNSKVEHAGKSMIEAVMMQTEGRPILMETKIDGERMLFHKNGDKVKLWSRKGIDYSDKYKNLVQIMDTILIQNEVHACILDGEVAAYNNITNKQIAFGNNRTYGKYESENAVRTDGDNPSTLDKKDSQDILLRFIAFDCLYYEGYEQANMNGENIPDSVISDCIALAKEKGHLSDYNFFLIHDFVIGKKMGSLLSLPFAARRLVLQNVCSNKLEPPRLAIIKSRVILDTENDIRSEKLSSFFDQENELGEEGIVVKDLSGKYVLNDRANSSWLKLKPEYSSQYADQDMLIVAASKGDGKNKDRYSSFWAAVRDNNLPPKYYTVGKVGGGFTDEERVTMNNHFAKLTGDDAPIPWGEQTDVPEDARSWLEQWKPTAGQSGGHRPEILLPPCDKSIVLTVKFAELVTSKEFSAGISMRFPRPVRIRYDKAPDQVETLDEMIRLFKDPKESLHHNAAIGERKARQTKAAKKPSDKIEQRFRSHVSDGQKLNVYDTISGAWGQGGLEVDIDLSENLNLFEDLSFYVHQDSFENSLKTAKEATSNPREGTLAIPNRQHPLSTIETVPSESTLSPMLGVEANDNTKKDIEVVEQEKPSLYIVDYAEKSIAMFGDIGSMRTLCQDMGGHYNPALTDPTSGKRLPGWIFALNKKKSVISRTNIPFVDTQHGRELSRNLSVSTSYEPIVTESAPSTIPTAKRISASSYEGIRVMISSNNGKLLQSYASKDDPFVIVGPRRPLPWSVKNTITNTDSTIVSYSYVIACIRAKQQLQLTPEHIVCVSAARYDTDMHVQSDLFGDTLQPTTSEKQLSGLLLDAELIAQRYRHQIAVSKKHTNYRSKGSIAAVAAIGETLLGKRAITSDLEALQGKKWRQIGVRNLEKDTQTAVRLSSCLRWWQSNMVVYVSEQCLECESCLYGNETKALHTAPSGDKLCDVASDSATMSYFTSRLRSRGVEVSSILNPSVTHVILVDFNNEENRYQIEEKLRNLRRSWSYTSCEHLDTQNIFTASSAEVQIMPFEWIRTVINDTKLN
jgi:ATP-dependent DNA ligase